MRYAEYLPIICHAKYEVPTCSIGECADRPEGFSGIYLSTPEVELSPLRLSE